MSNASSLFFQPHSPLPIANYTHAHTHTYTHTRTCIRVVSQQIWQLLYSGDERWQDLFTCVAVSWNICSLSPSLCLFFSPSLHQREEERKKKLREELWLWVRTGDRNKWGERRYKIEGMEEWGEELGEGRLISNSVHVACIPRWWRSLCPVNYEEHSSVSSPHGSTSHRSPKDRTVQC